MDTKIKLSDFGTVSVIDDTSYIPLITGNPLLNKKILATNLLNSVTGGTDSIIDISYVELYNLAQSNDLIPGQKYLIIDYQTTHIIPNTNTLNIGDYEPILVSALSDSKLEPIAYSTIFPQDILFYDINNDNNMVYGCTKGYIYRRIDTIKSNDIGFDYRSVKFRRWQINVTEEHIDGDSSDYVKGSIVNKTGNNDIYIKISDIQGPFTDLQLWRLLGWNNLSYISYTSNDLSLYGGNYIYNIPTSDNFFDFYLFSTEPNINAIQSSYELIYNNKIGGNLLINNNSVVFGGNFSNNLIEYNFNNNIIIGNFHNNTIKSNFNYNNINNLFENNYIGVDFSRNTVGISFSNNKISDYFSYNIVGNNFMNNTISNSFINNIAINSFIKNVIRDNVNGVNFISSTYVYGDFYKEVFLNSNNIPYLKYYNELNELIIIPANI